jgi:hypothetical protein
MLQSALQVLAAGRAACTDSKAVAPLLVQSGVDTNVTVYVLEEFPGVAPCTYIQGSLNLTNYLGTSCERVLMVFIECISRFLNVSPLVILFEKSL